MGLIFGLFVVGVICGMIGVAIANSKAADPTISFMLGAFLGPIGLLIVALLPGDGGSPERQLSTGAKKKCPRCAELVQPEALVCRFCAHEFADVPAEPAPTPIAAQPAEVMRPGELPAAPIVEGRGDGELMFIGVGGIIIVVILLIAATFSAGPTRSAASNVDDIVANLSAVADNLDATADNFDAAAEAATMTDNLSATGATVAEPAQAASAAVPDDDEPPSSVQEDRAAAIADDERWYANHPIPEQTSAAVDNALAGDGGE